MATYSRGENRGPLSGGPEPILTHGSLRGSGYVDLLTAMKDPQIWAEYPEGESSSDGSMVKCYKNLKTPDDMAEIVRISRKPVNQVEMTKGNKNIFPPKVSQASMVTMTHEYYKRKLDDNGEIVCQYPIKTMLKFVAPTNADIVNLDLSYSLTTLTSMLWNGTSGADLDFYNVNKFLRGGISLN